MLKDDDEVESGSGVPPSRLEPGTYKFTLVDLEKRSMKRGNFADASKGQSPEDKVTKIELHFREDDSGDVLTKLVGWSTVEKEAPKGYGAPGRAAMSESSKQRRNSFDRAAHLTPIQDR